MKEFFRKGHRPPLPDSLDRTALIVLAIQVAILLVYAVGIWKKSDGESSVAV